MFKFFNDVYRNKKVLVTGCTGFKGSWLCLWLQELGAEVYGIALESEYMDDHFNSIKLADRIDYKYLDIRNYESVQREVDYFQPDFIFHLAAQAIVGVSFENPHYTFETNIVGTLNILEAIRNYEKECTGVIITSDKCYKNVEKDEGYVEEDTIGGDDPYSASKGGAELVIASYIESFFRGTNKHVASTRAGNVIGGGDRSKFRLVPDCITALNNNDPIIIRNPESTRPWQHVLEPLSGYLLLGMHLSTGQDIFSTAWNFGPKVGETKTVSEVAKEIILVWGSGEISIDRAQQFNESCLLQLDCTKAKRLLDWEPTLNFHECIRFTAEWYKYDSEQPKKDMFSFSMDQIKEYSKLANDRGQPWIGT